MSLVQIIIKTCTVCLLFFKGAELGTQKLGNARVKAVDVSLSVFFWLKLRAMLMWGHKYLWTWWCWQCQHLATSDALSTPGTGWIQLKLAGLRNTFLKTVRSCPSIRQTENGASRSVGTIGEAQPADLACYRQVQWDTDAFLPVTTIASSPWPQPHHQARSAAHQHKPSTVL